MSFDSATYFHTNEICFRNRDIFSLFLLYNMKVLIWSLQSCDLKIVNGHNYVNQPRFAFSFDSTLMKIKGS